MRLFEHEAKSLLREYRVPVPNALTYSLGGELNLGSLRPPFYVKAQVPVGGRGKAGGILFARTEDEVIAHIQRISRLMIGGHPVSSILIEESQVIDKEFYLSIVVDRTLKCYTLIAGSEGGIDVEQSSRLSPETILKVPISPLREIRDFDISAISRHLGVAHALLKPIAHALWGIMVSMDAELVEVNPLILQDQRLVALDAKIQIDDNALFRQTAISSLPPRGRSAEEAAAFSQGLNYVGLDGEIGIIGNGAGLTMATMDLVKSNGGRPANFLDLGGGALSESFKRGVLFLMALDRVKAILINIFGGITRCDEVARGIAAAVAEKGYKKPVVVRLLGTNELEGRAILEAAGIGAFSEPAEASSRAIALAGGRT